jgi:hypothetical protein
VPSLPLCRDKTRFDQSREMFARCLRADMGSHSQFSCRHGATAHQPEQHGGAGGLGEQFGRICECITHKDIMPIIFLQ